MDTLCILVLCAAVVAFVGLVYGLGSDNAVYRSYDFREMHGHHKSFYRAALRAGRLPLWNPHTFSGGPFAANPVTQTFYPLSLLVLLLPNPQLAVTDLLIHLFLAAAGAYLLLRISFATGPAGAAFGGLVFATAGRFVGHAYAGHVPYYAAGAYIPWVLLGLERSAGTGTRGNSERTREPQPPLSANRGALRIRWLWATAMFVALQILAGGIQYAAYTLACAALYRTGEVLRCEPRVWRAWGREVFSLLFVSAAAAGLAAVQLLPSYDFFRLSSRAHTDYEYAVALSYPPALLPGLLLGSLASRGGEYFWEYYTYVGTLPVCLGLAAVWRARRDTRLLVLLAIALLTLFFSLGENGPVFPLFWKFVPGFGLFRAPARAMIILDLILAIVAGLMLAAAAERSGARAGRPRARIAVVLFACALTFADVTFFARARERQLAIPDPHLAETPDYAKLAQIIEADSGWYRYWFGRRLFPENQAYKLGARSVSGYEIMQVQRYRRFMYYMTDTKPATLPATIMTQQMFLNTPTLFPFKILGVKYVTHDRRILGRRRPVRRAWFVEKARVVADEERALAYMRSNLFQPEREAVFEQREAAQLGIAEPASTNPAPTAEFTPDVAVEETAPEHLRARVGPHADGYLVFSEIFYPGWHASIGGREVPIYRCDSILRCVQLTARQSNVEMVFAPRVLTAGAAVSTLTLVATVLGMLGFFPPRWRKAAAAA